MAQNDGSQKPLAQPACAPSCPEQELAPAEAYRRAVLAHPLAAAMPKYAEELAANCRDPLPIAFMQLELRFEEIQASWDAVSRKRQEREGTLFCQARERDVFRPGIAPSCSEDRPPREQSKLEQLQSFLEPKMWQFREEFNDGPSADRKPVKRDLFEECQRSHLATVNYRMFELAFRNVTEGNPELKQFYSARGRRQGRTNLKRKNLSRE